MCVQVLRSLSRLNIAVRELILKPAVIIHLLCVEGGDVMMVVILYITQCWWRVSLSLSLSLSLCASFSVLWKVLLSVGPRLTPTETVNYRRWQRSFHLATITHIPQPPSKDLQSPTQVQGGCSVGDQLRRGQMAVLQAHYTDIPLSEHSVSSVFTINTSIFFIVRSIKCQMPKSQPIDSLFTKPRLSL